MLLSDLLNAVRIAMPTATQWNPAPAATAGVLLLLGGCAAGYHHRSGLEAMDKGQYDEAVIELGKAAELDPEDVIYRKDWLRNREVATRRLLAQAEVATAEGRLDDAAQHYRLILKYEREHARAKAGLESLLRLKQADEQALQAREALKKGDSSQAAQLLGQALENHPGHVEALALKRELDAAQAKDLITSPSLSNLYKKPINLEFRDASLKMVFEALSRTTGINFIFDREVKSDQRTTVFLKQTTLEDAIDVILTTNQLDKKILNSTSVLVYPNTSAKTKEYQDLVVRAFYLSTAEAKQTAGLLKSMLKIKEVFVDDKLNMLMLRETPDTIALAEKLIALHDLDEPEVMLEVEVLEVNRTRMLELGIDLPKSLTVRPFANSGNSTGDGSESSPILYKLSELKNLNSSNLGVTLPSVTARFEKNDGDANLLANPRIRVKDREKAKIMIGSKVPVVTTTASSDGFISENVQYLDVGLKLEVEPDVHMRDEIGIKVGLEVSNVVNSIKTARGALAYEIGTRTANSVLRLKDGETQVLAGLIRDEDRSSASRIPLLGDVPLLGRLFSSQSDSGNKTEIILSITPRLIRNAQRKEPAAESFWSGTEANLRLKPLQLRSLETMPTNAVPAKPGEEVKQTTVAPAATAAPASAESASAVVPGVKLQWKGPATAKVGETVTLALHLDSAEALRAAPLQLAYDKTLFEVVSVKEGDYFSKTGKSNFSQLIDKASGRVSVGTASAEAAGAKGEGALLMVLLKPLQAVQEAEISVIGMTPIASGGNVGRPALPLVHRLSIVP